MPHITPAWAGGLVGYDTALTYGHEFHDRSDVR